MLAVYDVPGCTHDNVDIFDIGPSTSAWYVQRLRYLLQAHIRKEYQVRHLEIGIDGPTILLGLQPHLLLDIPECFLSEMMHLSGANMASLWLDLWQGTIECATTDNKCTGAGQFCTINTLGKNMAMLWQFANHISLVHSM